MTQKPLLTIKKLSICFEKNRVVDQLNLQLYPEETLALVGESGSGKSLTALAIMQLLPMAAKVSAQSDIMYREHDLLALPESALYKIRGRRIGMVFQEAQTALNPVLTIGQQINELLKQHFPQQSHRQRKNILLESLAEVGLPNPEHISQCYVHELSGGMRQRAMIAMVLAGQPEILIADEPTTALDVTSQAEILSLLKRKQAEHQMAMVFITHDLAIVSQIADRVAVMQTGKVIETNTVGDFLKNPTKPYSRQLLAAIPRINFHANSIQQHQKTPADTAFPHSASKNPAHAPLLFENLLSDNLLSDNLLSVKNLSVYFPIKSGLFRRTTGYIKAVDNISFDLAKGKTLALVGESGSGKTTTALGLLQLTPHAHGDVWFKGKKLTFDQNNNKKLRKAAQIIFQDPFSSMNPRMRIDEIIAEGMRAQGLHSNDRQKKIAELLALVELSADSASRYPHEFSGGQRQRICIARALAVEPELIVCDEPTSALDVTLQAKILALLKQLQEKFQLSYLLITHNLGVVSQLAHDVAIMHRGRLVEQGPTHQVLSNPEHPYTKQLLNSIPQLPAHYYDTHPLSF